MSPHRQQPAPAHTIEDPRLTVSIGPHIRSAATTSSIMWRVSFALMPAALLGVWWFGLRAGLTLVLAIGAAVLTEWLWQKGMKKPVTIADGSAFLTGLLVALNLPPAGPVYLPLVGSFVAIVLAKQLFGGLGFNIFNPALVGRAFLMMTFPAAMSTFSAAGVGPFGVDTVTQATPLTLMKLEGLDKVLGQYQSSVDMYWQLLLGNRAGSLGEVAVGALLLGAAYLLLRGVITWRIPFFYLGTVALLAWVFGGKGGLFHGDPLLHLLSGGVVLGAFFMATDYVTSPATRGGQVVFGVGAGVLLILIRLLGSYPEGCMFSILIMNCFAPLIDRSFRARTFGLPAKKIRARAVKPAREGAR